MSEAQGTQSSPPRFLTDANFNLHIIAGLWRQQPSVDVSTARQLGLLETPDPELLAYAKEHDRILLTHDRGTMYQHFDRNSPPQATPLQRQWSGGLERL